MDEDSSGAWRHILLFSCRTQIEHVALPRQSAVVRIVWQDDRGRSVPRELPAVAGYLKGWTPTAEPEYPTDKQTDARGWTEVSDTYLAPSKATRATIELHLQWAPPGGRIEWSEVSLAETAPPAGRKVRLAAAHFKPSGKSVAANREEAAPLIALAAKQNADLIVLGETLTYFGLGKSMVDAAETVPGPTTDYFGALAKEHNLYIVVGVVERDRTWCITPPLHWVPTGSWWASIARSACRAARSQPASRPVMSIRSLTRVSANSE